MAESDENVVVKSSRFVTEKEIENAGSPLKITEVNTEESVVEEQYKRRKREKEALKQLNLHTMRQRYPPLRYR